MTCEHRDGDDTAMRATQKKFDTVKAGKCPTCEDRPATSKGGFFQCGCCKMSWKIGPGMLMTVKVPIVIDNDAPDEW